jgi:hypothetical protein
MYTLAARQTAVMTAAVEKFLTRLGARIVGRRAAAAIKYIVACSEHVIC